MVSNIEQRKVRLRFIALYAVSIALAFVVVIGLWKRISDVLHQNTANEQMAENNQVKAEVQRLMGVLAQKDQTISQLEQNAKQQVLPIDSSGKGSQYVEALKQKDITITNLQAQLKQMQGLQTTTNTSADGGEWKQKYSSLKASHDKLAQSEQALKSAYKTVADDNKRLLTQLQSVKKG